MNTNKKTIRLTESKLRNIISESVKRVLSEGKRDFEEHKRLSQPYGMLESVIFAFEDAISYSDELRENTDMMKIIDYLKTARTILINKFMTYHPSVEDTRMYGD